MRCDTTQPPWYCGIALHARTMCVCSLSQDSEVVLHRTLHAASAPCLKAVAPYRDGLVVAIACLCTWYGLADWCAQAGLPLVHGHAWSRNALHGGNATNDPSDSQTIAVLLRGGMIPQASGYPAAMRTTRDLLRRRVSLRRQRAARLAHGQHTNRQDNWPESGQTRASKATRDGAAARGTAPAVPKSGAVDRALLDDDDPLRRDVAVPIVRTAKQPNAPTLSRRSAVPGLGKIVRLVLRSELPALLPSLGARMSWLRAGLATGRRKPRATAAAPPAHSAARRPSNGPLRQRRCAGCGTSRWASHSSPASSTNRVRVKRAPSARINERGQAMPCSNATRWSIGRRASTGEGAARRRRAASLDAHGLSLAGGALMISRCQGPRRSTEALEPCSLGRCWDIRSGS